MQAHTAARVPPGRPVAAQRGSAARRRLRRMARWALAAALLAGLWGMGTAQAAQVSYLELPAEIKHQGTTEWVRLNLGDTVKEGDTIRTGMGGRVEVTIGPKRVFRIGQASEVALPSFEQESGLKARVNLLLGRFWTTLSAPLQKESAERFQVTTTTATIGVKGTRFGVDFDQKDKSQQVEVIDGVVAAESPPAGPAHEISGPQEIAPPQEVTQAQWQVLVQRDQKLIVRPGQAPQVVPLTEQDKQDEWVAFNLRRDESQGLAK
ncbi:MAG TPA: FecR family protein [bacterium]|nr:FecR family protein [bacterium]